MLKIILTTAAFAVLISFTFCQQMEDYTGQVFPSNHALNTKIDHLPVHPNSDNIVASIGNNDNLHPDFGTEWEDNGTIYQIGMPYNIVDSDQPLVPISFDYADESDAGPWPIPTNPLLETVDDWRKTNDGDRHMLIIDKDSEILYESWYTFGNEDGSAWEAGSGAIFDLTSNDLRPETWTSSDATGLPVFPLLVRYDEVERAVETGGEIPHAIRFTANHTRREYIWPAKHYASSSTDPDHPPMGMRFRLKADFDISGFTPRIQVILRTLKRYGIILSDNGSDWFIQGTHDDRWDDEEIGTLKEITGNNFEAVDISSWINHPDFDPNSGAVPEDAAAINLVSTNNVGLVLTQNYPNPVQNKTTINYSLPVDTKVQIKITDLTGREIVQLVNKYQLKGSYSVEFDASDLPDGIYLYILTTSTANLSKRLIVLD